MTLFAKTLHVKLQQTNIYNSIFKQRCENYKNCGNSAAYNIIFVSRTNFCTNLITKTNIHFIVIKWFVLFI